MLKKLIFRRIRGIIFQNEKQLSAKTSVFTVIGFNPINYYSNYDDNKGKNKKKKGFKQHANSNNINKISYESLKVN